MSKGSVGDNSDNSLSVVQVVNHFYPCVGGVERVVQQLSKGLLDRGHRVKVVCLNKCANSQVVLPKTEDWFGVRVERLPFLDFKYYKVCFGLLNSVKGFDVVHVHGLGFMSDWLLLTKFFHKKRVVVSTHGGVFHTKKLGFFKDFYFWVVERFLLSRADKVLAVSDGDFEVFSRICSNVCLVRNGVEVGLFKACRKKLNSFVFVGRFSENKRVELLLRVFKKVLLEGKNFSLIICGSDWGGLLSDYKKLVVELGLESNVEFVVDPSDDELKRIYAESEFFVSASEFEGFGLALVEAMASKCIPIVHKNQGFLSVFKSVGCSVNDFLIDFGDVEEAKNRVCWFLGLSEKERKRFSNMVFGFSKFFSVEKNVLETEKVYFSVL